MKHITKILLSFISVIFLNQASLFSQTNWSNIYYAPAAYNTGYSYYVNNSIAVDGKLYIYGDTMGSFMTSPYIVSLNPSNQAVTPLNFLSYPSDYTVTCAATTNDAGVSYIYFGTKGQSAQYPGIYKYNTQTGMMTPEQLNVGMANYHQGIDNIAFYSNSGAASHDTLNVFANYFGAINVYRKHHTQSGFSSNATIPFQEIYESIVYRDTLYVFGYSNLTFTPRLYKSSDGLNYSECVGFSNLQSTLLGASYGFDLDTLNNSLYVLLGDNESFSYIVKTDNGSVFTETQAGGYSKRYVDLKNYKNKMWMCGKSMSFSANYNDLAISYLSPSGSDVVSVDTLGNYHNNYGQYFHLNVVNDSLYSPGYFNFSDTTSYFSGISIYKLTNPIANISYMNNIACLNSLLSFTSTSTYADSLHWLLDTTFMASSPGASAWYNMNFPTTGNHVVGLVAHGAGLTDTINVVITVYDIQASLSGSTQNCEGVPLDVMVSELGAYPPVNYQWYQSGAMSGADSTAYYTNPGPGNYTYNCIVTDVHGCVGYSDTLAVSINSSKNIFGLVTTNTLSPVPVAGTITLYKYEPFLTKFDSITTQAIDAAGGYTFTSMTAGDYIVKAIPSTSTLQMTYGTSFTTWQDATIISHGCLTDETKDIDVKQFAPLPGFGSGLGVLSGSISMGAGFGQKSGDGFKTTGQPIGGIVVKGGRNPGGQMFTQTVTGADGTYTISGLPDNDGSSTGYEYFIQVDIPGLDTNGTYHRVISGSNNSYTNLDFVVDSNYVNPINNTVSIYDLNAVEHELAVYPNPAINEININFNLQAESLVSIKLVDITGRWAKTLLPQTLLNADKHKQTYRLMELNSGLYFIKLNINGKESTIKLCITD